MAERLFRKAIDLDPHNVRGHVSLVAHLGWSGRNKEAEEYPLPAGVRDRVEGMRGRAAGLLWQKRPDEAEQLLRVVEEQAGLSVQDEWVLAGVELMRGNPDAERRLSAAVNKGPVTLRAIDTAGLYALIGNFRMATVHLERLFESDPSCIGFIEWSPNLASLRARPEVQNLIRKYRAAK